MNKKIPNYLNYDIIKHLGDCHCRCQICGETQVIKIMNCIYEDECFKYYAVYKCGHSKRWISSISCLEKYKILFTIKAIKR
ncbi:hypothetical protein M0R19_08200 [Candidatus Pacearchaeota archaeon]|jgi:hypothetical protein|nr:hypothetical protein [Candidatus Pacearchaeota archaeon]